MIDLSRGGRGAERLGLSFAIAVSVAAVAGGLAAGTVGMQFSPLYVLAFLAVVLLGVVLWHLPLRFIPAATLILFAVAPVVYLPELSQNGSLSPCLLGGVIFAIRSMRIVRLGRLQSVQIALLLISVWVAIATVLSERPASSFLWTVNFLVLVVVPGLYISHIGGARLHLIYAWVGLGSFLSLYGVFEFLIRANPVFDRLYAASSTPLTQDWSVYRITTSLGHPLVNALFFALATVLSFGLVARSRNKSWLATTAICGGGVLLSGSRAALIAVAAGGALMLLWAVRRRATEPGASRVVATVLVTMLIGSVLIVSAGTRIGTDDGERSSQSRVQIYAIGERLAADVLPWGAGPGLADLLQRESPYGDPKRGVESIWLQLAISLGLPGILTFCVTLLCGFLKGLRDRPEVSSAILVYVIVVSTNNTLEALKPALFLLGVLLGVATVYGSNCDRTHAAEDGQLDRKVLNGRTTAKSDTAIGLGPRSIIDEGPRL